MDASNKKKLELFDVGPCQDAYDMGLLIGERFSGTIRSRVAADLVLRNQLRPFARTEEAKPLMEALCHANKRRFPRYWDELLGTAEGSGVPALDHESVNPILGPSCEEESRYMVVTGPGLLNDFSELILVNFRKEILPFIPNELVTNPGEAAEDCSDILVVDDSMAIAAHNEDANVALVGHTYLVRAKLPDGQSFTAYTYAGELPSCAFGFNSHGMAFTLNAVPPSTEEIVAGGVGRNFISRDLLEATDLQDALNRVESSDVSVGHSYNLIDLRNRKILNVETASRNRCSVRDIGATPFFHANMYLHLQVQQVPNESSIGRQRRAALLSVESRDEALDLLGDCEDEQNPIYMTGPTLYTLCTALIDLDEQTLTILQANPKRREVLMVLPMSKSR